MKHFLSILVLILFFNVSKGQFSRKFDQFENEVVCSYNTPSISFNKYFKVKGTDTTYQTGFYLYDTYLTASGNDAILLFSDTTTINLEGKVDVNYSHGNLYRYSFYDYGNEIVEKLSKTSLIGFKLHIFEKKISKTERITIMTAAKKILSSK